MSQNQSEEMSPREGWNWQVDFKASMLPKVDDYQLAIWNYIHMPNLFIAKEILRRQAKAMESGEVWRLPQLKKEDIKYLDQFKFKKK